MRTASHLAALLVALAASSAAKALVPITNVSQVSAGNYHTCSVHTGGAAKCWGNNGHGQLGDNTTTQRASAVDVTVLAGMSSIAAGQSHTCAVTSGGGAKCWGFNSAGQLGNNSTNDTLVPVDVSGLTSGVSALDTTQMFTCALTTGGGMKCWGSNMNGQLGDGSGLDRFTPVDVAGLSSGVAAMATGALHACAVITGGAVKCWGRNVEGQLGDTTAVGKLSPVDVVGLSSGMAGIAAGTSHTCALTTGGGVKCWGSNNHGQLGDGTIDTRYAPVDVLASGVSAISAGDSHTCVLTTAGGVKCWGRNFEGQLGDNTTTERHTAVDVVGLTSGVTAISVGASQSCARLASGGVKCWGANFDGQLGNNTGQTRPYPLEVGMQAASSVSLQAFAATAAGGHPFTFTATVAGPGGTPSGSVAFKSGATAISGCEAMPLSSGSAQCTTSALSVMEHAISVEYPGDAHFLPAASAPASLVVTNLVPFGNVAAMTAGDQHTCALTTGGGVKCWGDNSFGQLGSGGSAVIRKTPADVSGLASGVSAIAAGNHHTCALTTGGAVKCWGHNAHGSVGNSSATTYHFTPVDVTGLASGVIALAGGGYHTCALTSGGGVKCWGYNAEGGLGDGTTTNRNAPVDVSGLASGVVAITAGAYHTCALTSGGGAKCWGHNLARQLGDNTTTHRLTPVDVFGLVTGMQALDAGGFFTCGVTTGSGLKCWGHNGVGQLGVNSTMNQDLPVDVAGLASGVVAVASGGNHSCALISGGGVKCWGSNGDGQLGDNTFDQRTAPVDVSGLASGVAAVTTGGGHSCALLADGGVQCWGGGASGQLGDNTTGSRRFPSTVLTQVASSVSLQTSGSPSVAGATVIFTATVTGSRGTPTGAIVFKNGATVLDECTFVLMSAGVATCNVSTLASGTHTIVAEYTGDATYLTSSATIDQAVNAATHQLTVTKLGAGSGLVASTVPHAAIECGATCSATFAHGTSVTLVSSTAAGSKFGSWSGCTVGVAGDCTVTMDGPKTVTATFDVDPNPPRLGNISTRMQVLTGNDVMIGGFVIGGAGTKRVAVVATGPSLAAFGITNALANPTLRLVRSSDQAVLATNDDWQGAANSAQLTALGLAPSHSLEAAILIDLAPGAYTAVVEGVGGGTGVSVVGVYEVDGPTIPLVNISTRGRVLTGNDVMIGGFVVTGSASQTVGIVATGPSLAAFGITSPLANPTIQLVRSSDQAVLATNDDWQSDASAAQLQAAGLAPTNPLESGIYTTLPPGAYTVIVQGVGGATGVAVIGVYRVF